MDFSDSMEWSVVDHDVSGGGFGFPQFSASFLEGPHEHNHSAPSAAKTRHETQIPRRFSSTPQHPGGEGGVGGGATGGMEVEASAAGGVHEILTAPPHLWQQQDTGDRSGKKAPEGPSFYRPQGPTPPQYPHLGAVAGAGPRYPGMHPPMPIESQTISREEFLNRSRRPHTGLTPGRGSALPALDTSASSSWQPFSPNRVAQHQQHQQSLAHIHQQPHRDMQSVLRIIEQPPVEVRTRTPGENRTFCVKAQLNDPQRCVRHVRVSLLYADADANHRKQPLSILGGTVKSQPVNDLVVFENLSLSEASTKHEEREFCLAFEVELDNGSVEPTNVRTTPFYAYSHKKVLNRRKNVELRALSRTWGPVVGGGEFHLVGMPFIKGPSLQCIFRTPNGQTVVRYERGLERYSDTVLFLTLPPCPEPPQYHKKGDVRCSVYVSNDGRNYSNALDFVYVVAKDPAQYRA
eukprot:TRINITY_DN4625_c0_g1_i1.p1 TRINITY_DN4625_c0_g1~~TRINITY_DN4625_c0_g1_i1.p1  ORF type:complete len:462 (+),score=116.59 TRINITY_DN4625_c0_g1_i1:45-1430(+)